MSEPLIEQIAVAIEAAVNAITVANGFDQTLTAVRPKRLHLEGDINTDLTVIIEQEPEPEIINITDTTISWRQGFALQAIVIDSDTSADAVDTRLNRVRSDIEKQMLSNTYHKLGGLAEGVLLRPPTKFIASPNAAGVSVNIDVFYTTEYDDPYTQAT
jgi:hypothetical protein